MQWTEVPRRAHLSYWSSRILLWSLTALCITIPLWIYFTKFRGHTGDSAANDFEAIVSWSNILACSTGFISIIMTLLLAPASSEDWKRKLANSVRRQEGQVEGQRLGLRAVRSQAAKPVYVVEHEVRFRTVGSNSAVRTDIADFFEHEAGSRLVILGPAGAGKTVLAVKLAMALLDTSRRDDAVPVRFDLANWVPDNDFGQWLATQLTARHGVPPEQARTLLDDFEIMPILDGLDEISAEREVLAKAVAAINAYFAVRSRDGFVLTCRNNVYSDIGEHIETSREITLLPLVAEEIIGFIEETTRQTAARQAWQPVLDAVSAGVPAVIAALGTPWRLTLAVTYFLDTMDTRDLVPGEGEDHDDYARRVGDLLIKTFAPARARIHGMESRQNADAWCRFIAEDLDLQVGRGSSRQDILAHYQADHVAGAEVLHRSTAFAFLWLAISLVLGALLLPAWFLDAVSNTTIISGVRSGMDTLARLGLDGAAIAIVLGVGVSLLLRRGVPRARKTTRRLLRSPALTHQAAALAQVRGVLWALPGYVTCGLPTLVLCWPVTFVIAWLVTGAGAAARVALVAGLIPAIAVGNSAALVTFRQHTFYVWSKNFLSTGTESSPQPVTFSVNWTFPGAEIDQVLGTPLNLRNWPAALETFLIDGYHAGIFRRSGDVYQFRHRQLQDFYSRQVDPLLAWDAELLLPRTDEPDGHLAHRLNMLNAWQGREAAQRLVLGGHQRRTRNEDRRAAAQEVSQLIKPPGVLSHCDVHTIHALFLAHDEARATGSAVIQTWHLLTALLADIRTRHPDCPADIDQIRAALRPSRTVSLDESPSHIPLAQSLRKILVSAPQRWNQRITPELLVHDLLNAGGSSTQQAILALRFPVDTETPLRAWLDEAIAQMRTGSPRFDPHALVELAVVMLRIDRPEDAERAAREAILLDPRDATAYGVMGSALIRQGHYDRAEAALRYSVQLDPQQPAVHRTFGNLMRTVNRLSDAADAYRRAARLDPDNVAYYQELADVHMKQREFTKAAEAYMSALEHNPHKPDLHRDLGYALCHLGSFEQAEAAYRNALRVDPRNMLSHRRLGELMLCTGRVDAARPHLAQAGPAADAELLRWLADRTDPPTDTPPHTPGQCSGRFRATLATRPATPLGLPPRGDPRPGARRPRQRDQSSTHTPHGKGRPQTRRPVHPPAL